MAESLDMKRFWTFLAGTSHVISQIQTEQNQSAKRVIVEVRTPADITLTFSFAGSHEHPRHLARCSVFRCAVRSLYVMKLNLFSNQECCSAYFGVCVVEDSAKDIYGFAKNVVVILIIAQFQFM